ncbi:MAG: DNA/RNA nuclease SfsA [Alphaproteobacteria bacterium]|jgi:sugar fermentation stimulation protein A|nr:DNA/RNA nuclease SfsA [Alphaproteobacteria bacterium]
MKQPNLIKAKFLKRYKRFLVDVLLENNEITTVHCANSGSMMGLLNEGNTVYISPATNPLNKLKYKLELIDDGSSLVGVNTHLANKLAHEAFAEKLITPLENYDIIKPEVKHLNSRFDFFLSNNLGENCFVEIKSITLKRKQNIAEFPDSPTVRGSKHLTDLIEIVKNGGRAINLYIIQRNDANYFKIAKSIDPKYYENFMLAKHSGVEFLCYSCDINLNTIKINQPIEIIYE